MAYTVTISHHTGYVVFLSPKGELPTVLSYEDTAEKAKAAALKQAADLGIDLGDVPEPIHVDCHESRDSFEAKDWLLFGQPYAPHGDVAVPHGTKPLEDIED